MSVSRRLINLAGALLVVVVFVVGVLLFAAPVYTQSIEVFAQKLAIEDSNRELQAKIDSLEQQKAQLPEIQKEVASLRGQIPGRAQTDDISRLVVESSRAAGVDIVKINYEDWAPFLPNTVQESAPLGAAAAPQESADGVASDGAAPTSAPTAGPAATDPATTDAATGQAQSANPETGSTDVEIPVTIDLKGDSIDQLSRFLDELRKGPRLLQIDSAIATGDKAESAGIALTVKGFIFVRIDPQGVQR